MRIPPANITAAAQSAARRTHVFASATEAQWIDESDWGAKCTGRFNFFGIKGDASNGTLCWTHEERAGHLVPVQAWFRNFVSLEEAFGYHADLIATSRHEDGTLVYGAAMACADRGDLKGYVYAMAKVYATASDYGDVIWGLIHSQGLLAHDSLPAAPASASAVATEQALDA